MSENRLLSILFFIAFLFMFLAIWNNNNKKQNVKFEISELEIKEKECLIQIRMNDKGVQVKTTWLGENERCFEIGKYLEEKYSNE